MPRIIEKLKAYNDGFPERQAGRNRLAWWAKLFMLAVWAPSFAAMWVSWILGFEALYHLVHPSVPFGEPRFPSGGLMVFPGLLAAIILSLIWTNIVCWLVPPVRRANEDAFRGVEGGSFSEATGSLAKGAAIIVPICIIIALIGVWEPWAH